MKLERTTFEVSRATEYFTEKELQRQIGRGKQWWPVALLKELVDNALDACEMGKVAPEIEVLCSTVGGERYSYLGERVELNAMTSGQLVSWLERKLTEAGVEKVMPEKPVLTAAYQRAVFLQRAEEEIERQRESLTPIGEPGPRDLSAKVRRLLGKDPTMSWDEAVWELVRKSRGGGDSGTDRA